MVAHSAVLICRPQMERGSTKGLHAQSKGSTGNTSFSITTMADNPFLRPTIYGRGDSGHEPQGRSNISPVGTRRRREVAPPSPQHKSSRKAASEQLQVKLCQIERNTVRSQVPRERRVTFQTDPPTRETVEDNPAFRQHERRFSGRAGDVTTIDHRIAINGGTTSTLECLPHRLRISKDQQTPNPQQRIEELTKQVGYHNQELAYYKDTRKTLMKLFNSMQGTQHSLQVLLAETDRELAISEQRYIGYWVPQHEKHLREENVF